MTDEATLLVCINKRSNPTQPSCGRRGGETLADALEALVRDEGLAIRVERICCLGRCERGPSARLAPGGDFLLHCDPQHPEMLLEPIREFLARLE